MNQTAIIDFLGVTFRVEPGEIRAFAEYLIKKWLGPEAILTDTGRGWTGYKTRIDIEGAGLLAFGGQDDTLHIELTGSGCMQVKDWSIVAMTIEGCNGRITRCDVAGDDYEGQQYNLAWAKHQYLNEGFKPARGTHPGSHLVDDMGTGKGCTLYVGSRATGKLFRGYEKGKQLGDPASPWFRVEVEYRATKRELPVQMLTNPSAYLAGSYPCLSDWDIDQHQIRTVAYTAEAELEKAMDHSKKQAGRFIHAMLALGHSSNEVVAKLQIPELPKRLCGQIKAYLALDESERTHTTATAPAWAAKATPEEHEHLQAAFSLQRRVWRTEQSNQPATSREATGALLSAFFQRHKENTCLSN